MSTTTNVASALTRLVETYQLTTPTRLKLTDSFLLFILLTGVFQFVYCLAVGTFPFNSFLSGFISTVGTFCLTASLRFQISNHQDFKNLSIERAFADWLFCNVVLHIFVISFMG